MGESIASCVFVTAREHARAANWISFCPSRVVSNHEELGAAVRSGALDLVIAYLSDDRPSDDTALVGTTAQALPVIAVPHQLSAASIVSLLELGADDVVADDVSPPELLARCRAILRRNRRGAGALRGSFAHLRRAEANLLAFFLQNRGRVISQQELIARVFGGIHAPDSALVRVHVAHLRKSLGTHRSALRTLRGQGYVLDLPAATHLTMI